MKSYYFTFGPTGTYKGGWIKVQANSLREAQVKFKEAFGQDIYDELTFYYLEEEFFNTDMLSDGNFGYFEWEVVS